MNKRVQYLVNVAQNHDRMARRDREITAGEFYSYDRKEAFRLRKKARAVVMKE